MNRLPLLMTGRQADALVTRVARETEERVWARAKESYTADQAALDYNRRSSRWLNLTEVGNYKSVVNEATRQSNVKWSRANFLNNPLVIQAARLYAGFVFGRGVTVPKLSEDWVESLKAETKEDKPKAAQQVETMVKDFWLDRWVQYYLSGAQSQIAVYLQLLRDGEVPILVFGKGGRFSATLLDSLEIVDVLEHRTRPGVPVLWKRKRQDRNGATFTEWYPALEVWDSEDEWREQAKTLSVRDYGAGMKAIDKTAGGQVWLYMVKLNRHEALPLRGHPAFWAAIPWCAAVQDQIANLRTYCRSLAAWAWRQKMLGASGPQLQAAASALSTPLDSTTQHKPLVGSVRVESGTTDLEPISLGTGGAQSFAIGIEQTLQMVYAATGLPKHYFTGDQPGGLTNKDQTELRVRKLFEAEQQFWVGAYDALFQHLARIVNIEVNTPSLIDFDFPTLVDRDAVAMLPALAQATVGGIIAPDDACRTAAYYLGAEDIDAWVERLTGAAPDDLATATEIEALIEREPLKAAPIVLRWSRRVQKAAQEHLARESAKGA